MKLGLLIALASPLGHQRAGFDRLRAADQLPQLVVAQKDHIVRFVEMAGLDELSAYGEQDQPKMSIGALVDVEMVIGRERRHPEVHLVRRAHLLERVAGQALEDLAGCRLDVLAHCQDRARKVVIGLEVTAHELEDRPHLLADRSVDELVAPDGVPAELALVRLDPFGNEPASARRCSQGLRDRRAAFPGEGPAQLLVVANLILHAPERLNRVPVPVRGRVLEPPEELLVDLAAGLLHDGPQVERRGELGEVQHPVDLPVTIVDVDRILEKAGDFGEGHPVRRVEPLLQVGEIALHLGPQAIAPPVGEVASVNRQDDVEVCAHRRLEVGIARDPRLITGAVFRGFDVEVGIGRDRRRVDVAVHVLGEPVDGEWRSESPEHVIAAEPPATDVEEHRTHGVWDVEVVVHPEEFLFGVRIPHDWEGLVTKELAEDLICRCHGLVLHRRSGLQLPPEGAAGAE